MKDEKENIFSGGLNNLDDADVEKISATVPALDKQTKKRILEKCMSKMAETDFESESTVSGTEKYSRPRIMHYIPTAVACMLAVVGLTGMILVNRNMGTPSDNTQSAPQYTAIAILKGTTDKAVSSTESTVRNTVTTAVHTEKATVGVITVLSTEVPVTKAVTSLTSEIQAIEQVAEPITEPATEFPIEQVAEAITEPPTEIPTTEEVTEPPAENDLFVGKYSDKTEIDYGTGSNIIITETGDNSYNVYIGFFRVAGFELTGSVNDDGILIFTTQNQPETYCEMIFAGEIMLNEDGCMLKITESTFSYIQADSDYTQYYRINE